MQYDSSSSTIAKDSFEHFNWTLRYCVTYVNTLWALEETVLATTHGGTVTRLFLRQPSDDRCSIIRATPYPHSCRCVVVCAMYVLFIPVLESQLLSVSYEVQHLVPREPRAMKIHACHHLLYSFLSAPNYSAPHLKDRREYSFPDCRYFFWFTLKGQSISWSSDSEPSVQLWSSKE